MDQGEARALARVRMLIALAEAPRFLCAAVGLILMLDSASTVNAPLFDGVHILVEAAFASVVIVKFGRETPRAWYAIAYVLAATAVLLAIPALVELVEGTQVGAQGIAVAEVAAWMNLGGNVLSLVGMLAISKAHPRRILTGIEVPHLWADVGMSGCVLLAMGLFPTVPWADGVTTLLLATFVLFLAWRATREAVISEQTHG